MKLTTDRYEALRGLFATAELLVIIFRRTGIYDISAKFDDVVAYVIIAENDVIGGDNESISGDTKYTKSDVTANYVIN